MIERDYLIVGTGIAGVSAADGIRQYDKKGKITLVGNEIHLPYHRPALSKKFLGAKKIAAKDGWLHPTDWYEMQQIELRLGCIVRELNIERRLAVLNNGQTIAFNKACLATGSRPVRPPVAGATLGNVIYLRTWNDALALREMLTAEENLVVVGGGLIALEAAAALRQAKLPVALLQREPVLWPQYLDPDTAQWLTNLFRQQGVTLHLPESLNGFEGKTVLKNVQTKSGNRYAAGVALVALGVEPNLELVRNTPLSSPKGMPVNEFLETDEKGIYAVGDVALFPDRVYGGARRVDHWESARLQGLMAGANMTGKKRQRYDYLPAWESETFDLHWRFLGDFTLPPTRYALEGSREKRSFVLRSYSGDRLRGAVLVNRSEEEAEAIKKTIRTDHANAAKPS